MISEYIFIQSKQICIQKKKKTFLLYKFFHPIKIFLYYMKFFIRSFSSDHIWSFIFICKSQNFTFGM